jgi:hypothetical protein
MLSRFYPRSVRHFTSPSKEDTQAAWLCDLIKLFVAEIIVFDPVA